jgi:hypothetical protein
MLTPQWQMNTPMRGSSPSFQVGFFKSARGFDSEGAGGVDVTSSFSAGFLVFTVLFLAVRLVFDIVPTSD